MRKILTLFLLAIVLFGAFSPDDGCCSGDETSATASLSISDTTDSSMPANLPIGCECPQCTTCFRCGHFAVTFGESVDVVSFISDTNNFSEYASFFAPSPYIPGLKRPPII